MTELIYSYTRKQALEDGVLVDISQLASEAGFRYPVAVSRALWEGYIRPPAEGPEQSDTGKLWDVLNVLLWQIRRSESTERLTFQVLFRMGSRTVTADLISVCGPGDEMEPVITIMLPGDD